jgi:uncharacterized protein with ParB-like and HNH nuclease domain
MIMDSSPATLRELFEGKYFRIPRYQRPYSWERIHLEDFWHDAVQSRSKEDYFIGSLVASKPRKEHVYAVVDGQQRITTAAIVLCALRNALQKEGLNDLADGIHTLIERRNIRNRFQFILTTESSYPFLQEHILKRGTPELETSVGPEEEAIKAAADFFASKFSEVVKSVRTDSSLSIEQQTSSIADKLEVIRDQILSLQVIFVELEDEDDAYLVFETLNTRGKDLRVSDLVKNLLLRLKRPTNEGLDAGKEKWNRILEILEESEAGIKADAFLHHSWLSRRDFVAQKKLFKEIKKTVTKQSVDTFLDELVRDAELYRVLHEPNFRKRKWNLQEKPLKDALVNIDKFGIKLSVPLILALIRDWNAGALNLATVRDTVAAIESFHMVFNAVTEQRATGGLAMMFASLSNQLSNAKPNEKKAICAQARNKLRECIPDFETFRLAFRKIVYTKSQTKHKALVRRILERISEYRNWPTNAADLTVEHFASQSGKHLQESVLGQIGNLLLVPPKLNNEKLRDKAPAEKRSILLKHQFPIPNPMTTGNWERADIERHTDELAELCYNHIWRI